MREGRRIRELQVRRFDIVSGIAECNDLVSANGGKRIIASRVDPLLVLFKRSRPIDVSLRHNFNEI